MTKDVAAACECKRVVNEFHAYRAARNAALKLLSLLLPLLVALTLAQALDSSRQIAQYGHRKWTMQEGLFNGTPISITQTSDGYVWFGTQSGLLRFDGVRFVRATDIIQKLPSSFVWALMGARDGSLWIGTNHGLAHWVDQRVIAFPEVTQFVSSIIEDENGKIWFAVANSGKDPMGAFCDAIRSATICHERGEGNYMPGAYGSARDTAGYLWAGVEDGVVRWRPGSFAAYHSAILKSKKYISGVLALAPTQFGSIWVGMPLSGPGLGLQLLDSNGHWGSLVTPQFDSNTLAVRCMLLDREGTLWVGTDYQGLYRIHGRRMDVFRKADGLSGDSVSRIYEDREGNIWPATLNGFDCFHELAMSTYSGPDGSWDEVDGIIATRDGTVWIERPQSLHALRNGEILSLQTGKRLPGRQATSLFEDRAGGLWVGVDETLSIYRNGIFHPVSRAGTHAVGLVYSIAEDTDGSIWAEVKGTPFKLLHIRNRQVVEEFHPTNQSEGFASVACFPSPKMPAGRRVAADPAGGIWLGLLSGDLARYRDGRVEVCSYPRSFGDPKVRQLSVTPGGMVLGSTEGGLLVWNRGRKPVLRASNGLPCDGVFAHNFDARNSLWLYTECRLVEITELELQRWLREPGAKLHPKTLDLPDGVQPGDPPFKGAARTPDGQSWFADFHALQTFDPARIPSNVLAPSVRIGQLIADRKSYPTISRIRLPSLIRDVEIDYSGLSFAVPAKVRFRYKLVGQDGDWQEPGTRRQAFYSDLLPGTYQFRLIACNNDGVWNETGATLDFSVARAWYQTSWFRLTCVAGFLILVWGLYRLRLRQLAHRFNTKLDASVAERTRIAGELHDTLLQSLHGLMFRFQAARNMLPQRTEEAMGVLDAAIARTEQALAESGDAIRDLRGASLEHDLAESLTQIGQDFAGSHPSDDGAPVFSVMVEGQPRPLTPIIEDEVRRIGREVLTNAFRHAYAHRIEAEIRYDRHSLRLRFRDDGMGIDPGILNVGGRPGHWGLSGIRERAQRIGAKLDFWSHAGAGTEVQLTVSATVAYERSRERARFGFIHRWRNRVQRS